jgi:hypothetical protein
MTSVLREVDRVETRVLGALRFVDDATGVDIVTPLTLEARNGHARFVRNRSGIYVVAFWSELAAHEAAFQDPPAEPAVGSLELIVAIADPAGRYLPRLARLALPRDPDPDNADGIDSLFRPARVAMYPAASAPTGSNWSVLHVTVLDEDSGDALGGALLRVRRNGDVIARALTDGRGQALLPIVGIPMLTFGEDEDAVVVDEVSVTVEAVFDPDTGTRMPAAALSAGARPPVPLVDPEALDADDTLPEAAQTLAVAARRSRSLTLMIDVA